VIERSDVLLVSNAMYNVFTHQLGRREERIGPPMLTRRRKGNIRRATTAGPTIDRVVESGHVQYAPKMIIREESLRGRTATFPTLNLKRATTAGLTRESVMERSHVQYAKKMMILGQTAITTKDIERNPRLREGRLTLM
jgi:hypothetical protein